MLKTQTPDYWPKAVIELASADSILAQIMSRYDGEVLSSRGSPFCTLLRSIVGQQISVKAADSVWRRLELVVDTENPQALAGSDIATLRAAGLSQRKAEYSQDLARHFIDGSVNPILWQEKEDEEIIQELCQIRGIGRWTAEMFLIFHLLRPNVFPADDLGLQKAIALAYGKPYPLADAQLKAFRRRYSPWATVATWYLWRSLDPIPVAY